MMVTIGLYFIFNMVTIGMFLGHHRVDFHSMVTIGIKASSCTSFCQHFSKKLINTDKDG